MKKTISSVLLLLSLIVQPVMAGGDFVGDKVEAFIVERSIWYPFRANFGYDKNYPALSYNDNTYVSVKLVAEAVGYTAEWVDFSRRIYFKQPPKEEYVVKNEKVAESIGRAIIESYFPDKVTDSTEYVAVMETLTDFNLYWVLVKFDVTETFDNEDDRMVHIVTQNDAYVKIDPVTGEILSISERVPEGGDKTIYSR